MVVGLKEFNHAWYDYDYFANPRGKTFKMHDGTLQQWGYRNPSGDFLGAKEIAEAWQTMFHPQGLLEFGAGRGTVIAYARDAGIAAEGFDYSAYATSDEGRFHRCRPEWLICHDATTPWPYPDASFDLVVGLDIMEHIYTEDVAAVIREMYRVARKYVFLEIATVDGVKEVGYKLNRGSRIPLDVDGRTWAGHVYVTTEREWMDRLEHDEWWRRRDLENWFISLVPKEVIKNWLLNSVIILSKVGAD